MKKEEKIAKKIKELQESVQELKEMGVGYLLVTSYEKNVDDNGFQELRSSVLSGFKLHDMALALASYFSEKQAILPVITSILVKGYSQEMVNKRVEKEEEELARKKKEWN